jgi:predicted sugar kinase
VGIGQTSWGPTGFAFTDTEAAAARLYDSVVGDATAVGLELMIVRGRNAGARMEPV